MVQQTGENREGGSKRQVVAFGDRQVVMNIRPNNPMYYRVIKRLFDIIVSLIAIICFSPIMLIIVCLIKLEDGGPVLYRSVRIGTGFRKLKILKFRSMVIDADQKLSQLLVKNDMGTGPRFKMKNDPRITKIGRVLRKYSLDELPQLFNILVGDISLVGPRPHSVYEVEQYNDYALQRFLVKSGMACYSECEGRSNLSFDESIESDIRYLTERSLVTDFTILVRIALAILKHEGAV